MKSLSANEILKIKNMYKKGLSLNKISTQSNIKKSTVYYHIRKFFGRKTTPLTINLGKTELLGEFLGFFIGDGNFYFDSKTYQYRISFFLSPKEPLILERISTICYELFNKKPSIWYNKDGHVYIVRIYGKNIYLLLKKFLIWGRNKTQTITLKENFLIDRNLVLGIIRGIINTDGSVYIKRSRVSFGSVSKNLITQFAQILNTLNVKFISYKVKASKNKRVFYTIEIEGLKKIQIFNEKVRLIHSDKQIQINTILSSASVV